MKVLVPTPRYAPSIGGVEVHVEGIARGLAAAGCDVTVLTQARSASVRQDGPIAVRAFREVVPSEAYPVAPSLFRWLSRNVATADVVHAHGYHGVPALAAALAAPQRFVFTPHFHGGGHTAFARLLHRGYGVLGRRIFERADTVVCVSGAEAELVADHHPSVTDRVVVIPNGVDVDAIDAAEPFDADRPVVLVLGRLVAYKHVDHIIRAMVGVDADLVIVGTGPARTDLEAAATALGVRVTFTGRVEAVEVHRWLKTASVVASASAHEAFGLTLLEGLTAGARIVASDIPSHREVGATWGRDGAVRLADVGDLADAIREQLAAGRLAPEARPRWSWGAVAERVLSTYGVLEVAA